MWKMTFGISIKSLRFETPESEKTVFMKVSVYVIGVEKVRTSSLRPCLSYLIPTLPTLFFRPSHFHINWDIELKLWVLKKITVNNI